MNSSAIVREAVLLVRDFDGPAGKPREAAHLTFAGDLKKPNDRVPAPDRAAVDDPGVLDSSMSTASSSRS